ncbi:hypothetical protein [Longispora urticae]
MASPVQIAKLISYALANLGAENGHHQFEHLCRHLAKRRIASNVLPATGPVSAGGDQSRDFETFHTYLQNELRFSIGYVGLAAEDTVVFACTIQKDRLRAKFEADIQGICTQGTPVDRIYIFSTENLPTGLRHDIITWGEQNHHVAVEILDRAAIAELLADSDLYWIAEEYLSLPSELAPPPPSPDPETPGWYAELRAFWHEPHRQPSNLGDFVELRRGLRHAKRPGPAREDLDSWLSLTRVFIDGVHPGSDFWLMSVYESATAHAHAKADLRPIDDLVRRFAATVSTTRDPTILFNASILFQVTATAALFGHTDIPLSEISTWLPPIRRHLDTLLEEPSGPNNHAGLLQVAAHLAFHVDFSDITTNGRTVTLDDLDERHTQLISALESGELQGHTGKVPLVDVDGGMRRLTQLADLLPQAPAYPIDTFATIIDLLAPSLRGHPLYRQVCHGLDAAVQRQEGEAAVAVKCRRRATALVKDGLPLEALREFHNAKVNWFHGDTLPGTLRVLAGIADIYADLGMYLAAKKYALALASLARTSADADDRNLVPIGLFAASGYDHNCGAWIASADLASIACLAHHAYAPNSGDLTEHPLLLDAATQQATTILIARQTRPQFEDTLWQLLGRGHLDGLVRQFVDTTESAAVRTTDQWLDWLPERTGLPFADAGPRRWLTFHALGTYWKIHCDNSQPTVLALEDFASTLQILLVEFATLDSVHLPHDVNIEIRTYPAAAQPARTAQTLVKDGCRFWLLHMAAEPHADDLESGREHVLGLAFQVLAANSLRSRESFAELMEQAARNGVFHKVEIGRPYHELANFRPSQEPPLAGHQHKPLFAVGLPQPHWCSPHLTPPTGPGPGYEPNKAQQIIAERYELLPIPIRYTLPALLAEEGTRNLFQQLRDKGWKDWHLLVSIMNITVNHRLTTRHGALTAEMASFLKEEILQELHREEQPEDPRIVPSQLTPDAMHQAIIRAALSSLRHWDLQLHHGDTPTDAVMAILAERYGFWTDDSPHQWPRQRN